MFTSFRKARGRDLRTLVSEAASIELGGTETDRRIGVWSARAIFVLAVPYAATFVVGFVSLGNLRDPLPDPYLAIGEVLILLMAPAMVMLMVAIHACAPPRARTFSSTDWDGC